jgi:hypothetical protein
MVDVTKHSAEDKGEYDYEGDMAKSQLRSILVNAKRLHDMLQPNSNLPEWVQSKITLAEDYILTAANYMEGEMNEEMKPYVKAAQAKFDAQTKAQNMGKKQAGTLSAKKEREQSKQAKTAQKVLDIVKGKKNKVNVEPKVQSDDFKV